MNTTPAYISSLRPNEVFVFGSNLAGRHGAGAARTAAQKFGAIYGKGEGLMGRSYALPTKGHSLEILPLTDLREHIHRFMVGARANQSISFLVTEVGCGLAGRTPKEVAPLFFEFGPVPENVSLPESFWREAP